MSIGEVAICLSLHSELYIVVDPVEVTVEVVQN
jgi:hypothetical protein